MGHVHRFAGPPDLSLPEAPGSPAPAGTGRPWRRATAWLLLLGPFFFASYGFATWVSSQRPTVGAIMFDWERHIPLLPWTIVPYWLIDLLYGVSLFICRGRRQLDAHAHRLLATQLSAVTCFLLFPLRCTFERGEVSGVFGWLFGLLMSFDQPFNQAPSLHIALLVVLLEPYLHAVPRAWHGVVYAVALLIAVSVLTTWQHHFFDVPTGWWLGCFAVWLFPEETGPLLCRARLRRAPGRRRLALLYATAGLGLVGLATAGGGVWLWLLWPAAALVLVGVIYLLLDGEAFGKQADGSMPVAVRCLFGPYLLGAWLNSRCWTRQLPVADTLAPGVLLGRLPGDGDLRRLQITALVDVCAELPCTTRGLRHASVPMLDLLTPDSDQLERAVTELAAARPAGPVLLCCALGLARSALVAAAWLLRAGLASSVEEAVAQVRRARPAVVIGKAQVARLRQWQQEYPRRPARPTDEHRAAVCRDAS